MEVVKELAAEFQIQLAAELGDPLFDMGGLCSEIFLIVKANGCHMRTTPFSFFPAQYITFVPIWKDKPRCLDRLSGPAGALAGGIALQRSPRLPHRQRFQNRLTL